MYRYQKRDYVRNNNYLIPCVIFLDFFLFAGVVLLWYFMTFWETEKVFRVTKPYIPCMDQVHYNYPKESSGGLLPDIVVYVLGFALPAIVILFGEAILAIYQIQGGRHYAVIEREIRVCGLRFHPILRRSVRYIGVFALGGFVALIMARLGQLVTGRPKPHYFSSCGGISTCTDELTLIQLDCNQDGVRESFPSMHATLSAYSSVFTGIYVSILLQPLKTVRSVRPLLCLCILTVPYMVGLERIVFFEAHWDDVIAGWVLGALSALYLIFFVLNQFKGVDVLPRGTSSLSSSASFRDTVITNPHRTRTLEMNGTRNTANGVQEGTYKEQQFRAVLTRNRPLSSANDGDFYAYRYIYNGSNSQASRREGVLPTVPENSTHVYHNATGHNTISHVTSGRNMNTNNSASDHEYF